LLREGNPHRMHYKILYRLKKKLVKALYGIEIVEI
jgi:hypothetical protein